MNIPQLIKEKRQQLNETQAEFGKRLGISHAAVSDLERGATKAYTLEVLQMIQVLPSVTCPVCKGKGYLVDEKGKHEKEI